MRIFLFTVMLSLFSATGNAKVIEPQPVAPSAQNAEIFEELEDLDEDIEFDAEDDLFISTADDTEALIVDKEIEEMTLNDDKSEVQKEAKAPASTTKKAR
jgi:hypothetical protein